MVKPCVLLLLLAVAGSQVDLSLSVIISNNQETNITECPIAFYGRTYTWVHFSTIPTLAICFKNNQSDPEEDCLKIADDGRGGTADVYAVHETNTPVVGSVVGTSSCFFSMDILDVNSSDYMDFRFYNFGQQAALRLDVSPFPYTDMNVTAMIGNTIAMSWSFGPNDRNSTLSLGISGCRLSDAPYVVDTSTFEIPHPENCSRTVCLPSAVIGPASTCGDTEFCHGDFLCLPAPSVCTVTGHTVIDFFNNVHSVPDRCVYSLLRPTGSSDFELLAGFRERRLQNVPFLDYLLLEMPNTTFLFEQGGRVRMGEQILPLSETPQEFQEVLIWKDETGVAAKIPLTNMTVFFDGYTAHVTAYDEAVGGLCGNIADPSQTTNTSAEKSFIFSHKGCDILYNDTDSSVNCTTATEHCDLLMQAPFTDCHNYTEPAGYITACTNILCNYPVVDDLRCQLLEAYAKTCSLKRVTPLEDWRSSVSCSPSPQAFCQDKHCVGHEFCGESLGVPHCLCRAIFASGYRDNDTLGQATVCTQNSASITVVGCLLEEIGVEYSSLRLNDENCSGSMDNETHMVTFGFSNSDPCGTEVTRNKTHAIFQNTITTMNSTLNDTITRTSQFVIDFTCLYEEPVKTLVFRIKESSVVQQIDSGIWNYTLMMNAYTDSNRVHLVAPNTEIELNQKIWVELTTEGLEDSMVLLVTESCWATNLPASNATLKYYLITGGCPADKTVAIAGNGIGTSNYFSFNMFEFTRKNNEVYLHCKLTLCPKQSNTCAPTCGGGAGRKRRSFRRRRADENPVLITMVWSK